MTTGSLNLSHYIDAFTRLRRDASQSWPATTLGRAPYKPLMLLSVIDGIAEGSFTENVIRLGPDLCDLFNGYWDLAMPAGQSANIAMPFYYLQSEGFWHLIPYDGSSDRVSRIRKPSVSKLHRHVEGARLDEELFLLLTTEEPREMLRTTLIQSHFAPEIHDALVLQGSINVEASRYSHALLEWARRDERVREPLAPPEPVRDQGFRRAIVAAYNHRCAFCGISIRTPDNHTAVDAAHIIDWSVSHDDDPRNGIALCKLCHWTFDAYLVSVSASYEIIFSKQLMATYNFPGHISTLEGRGIIGPEEHMLWPSLDNLAWHRARLL